MARLRASSSPSQRLPTTSKLPNDSQNATEQLKSLIHPSLTHRQNSIVKDTQSLFSQSKFDKAKRVFDYINSDHIGAHRDEQQMEREQQQQQIDDEKSQTKPVTLFNALFDTCHQPQNINALKQLLTVTILMITLPISTLYAVHYVLITQFHFLSSSALTYGAISSILIVNIITIGFGLFAYYEKEENETDDIIADRELRMKYGKESFIQKAKIDTVEQLQDDYIQLTNKQNSTTTSDQTTDETELDRGSKKEK